MEIQFCQFQKKFTGPIPGHYAEINIQSIKLKPCEILLLDGPSMSSKRVFMNIIRGVDKPDLCKNELPKLNYVFKQQVLSSKEQFSSINKILEGERKK